MIKGSLYLTTDLNLVLQSCTSSLVVIISDPVDQNLVIQTNAQVGSILLPPYNASEALLDNNFQLYNLLYGNHLESKEAQNFIALIIRCLTKGINILLYMPPDEFGLYGEALYNYFIMSYGLVIGTPNSPFNILPNFIGKMCTILYFYDLISAEEFFINYPPIEPINQIVVPKLVNELNPYVQDRSLQSYINYFFNLKEKIKRNNNKMLISPITMGNNQC